VSKDVRAARHSGNLIDQAVIAAVLASWTVVLAWNSECDAQTKSGDRAVVPLASAAIELRDGMAVPRINRGRRAVLSTDPVAAQVVAGTWTMPKAGDSVVVSPGQSQRWEPIKAGADGWFAGSAVGGGYVASTISSANDAVMILEASGHSMVYLDQEPRAGDPYAAGLVQLPVRLHRGPNAFLFHTGQGRLKARLTMPKGPVFFNTADSTTPDLIVGAAVAADAAVVVVNATETWQDALAMTAMLPGGDEVRTTVPALAPLSARKVGFAFRGPAPRNDGRASLELKVQRKARDGNGEKWETLDTAAIALRVCQPAQTHKRTFRSGIDGSVQYYAVVPARPPAAAPPQDLPGLVLTLHGAAVEAIGQAQAYAPKPGLHIVAPTNRRAYGFDWEDWGRLDALEVLDHAQKALGTDPRRTYLTGHSMGGHGTWHLGVTYPARFAAIGPSAGWISMWSYAGVRRGDSPNPVERLVERAASPSDTLALARNLSQLGVYILHGDHDDNVPVDQARRMRQALAEFHPDFSYYERSGAGHWWGSACVDWPPLFEFLERHTIPAPAEVRRVDFVTASPGVSHRAHWVSIEAQLKGMVKSTVHIELDREHRRFHGTTDNVARLALEVGHALPDCKAHESFVVELDGQTLTGLSAISSPSSGQRSIWLVRSDGKWSAALSPAMPSRKRPARQGPFKEAFRNRFMLVVGTLGTPEENACGLARARFDAETFGYRGNGSVDIVPDVVFLDPGRALEFRDRSVIVYGNSASNAAWSVLLDQSPVQVRRGQVQIGKRTVVGDDLACLFLQPRPGSDRAAVGVVAGSGLVGLRLTERLPYFISGVAYPDCLIVSAKSLSERSAGLIAAGYFGPDWDVESGEFAWRD
jgi:poly(3-hydroxybutyrate) depolymerase